MRRVEIVHRLEGLRSRLDEAGVLSLYLFGSAGRDEATDESDVDLLIDPDYARFEFTDLLRTEQLLSERLGRPVDLVTREGLRPEVRAVVEREAVRII